MDVWSARYIVHELYMINREKERKNARDKEKDRISRKKTKQTGANSRSYC